MSLNGQKRPFSQTRKRDLSRVARRGVTVILSGDGSDELLAGYNRYLLASNYLSTLLEAPRPIRLVAAGLVVLVL